MGGSGNGPTECGSAVQRPNLDGLEKIDIDAITDEIPNKVLATAFRYAILCDIYDIEHSGNHRRLCLEIMKGCLTVGDSTLIIQAYGYVLNQFSSYWKEKGRSKDRVDTAQWRVGEIQIELVQYFLNIGCTNLAIVIAEKILLSEVTAKAFLKIFLAQKAGTNGGPYR